MKTGRIFKTMGLCLIALVLFLVSTRPAQLPPVLLVVPFLLLFICLFLLLLGLFSLKSSVNNKRSIGTSLLLAATPTVLIAFQSLGQLSWRDAITVLLIVSVVYAYLSRVVFSVRG